MYISLWGKRKKILNPKTGFLSQEVEMKLEWRYIPEIMNGEIQEKLLCPN